jgi:hypothetical protein
VTATRTAYEDTKVPVHKTREDIDKLLRAHGATGMAWMEGDHPNYKLCRVVALRFIRPEKVNGETVPLAVRIIVPVPVAEIRNRVPSLSHPRKWSSASGPITGPCSTT